MRSGSLQSPRLPLCLQVPSWLVRWRAQPSKFTTVPGGAPLSYPIFTVLSSFMPSVLCRGKRPLLLDRAAFDVEQLLGGHVRHDRRLRQDADRVLPCRAWQWEVQDKKPPNLQTVAMLTELRNEGKTAVFAVSRGPGWPL